MTSFPWIFILDSSVEKWKMNGKQNVLQEDEEIIHDSDGKRCLGALPAFILNSWKKNYSRPFNNVDNKCDDVDVVCWECKNCQGTNPRRISSRKFSLLTSIFWRFPYFDKLFSLSQFLLIYQQLNQSLLKTTKMSPHQQYQTYRVSGLTSIESVQTPTSDSISSLDQTSMTASSSSLMTRGNHQICHHRTLTRITRQKLSFMDFELTCIWIHCIRWKMVKNQIDVVVTWIVNIYIRPQHEYFLYRNYR